MGAEICQFPVSRRLHNERVAAEQSKRNELSDYLHEIAEWIRTGDIESDPTALLLVLSGRKGDEVVWKGYAGNPEVNLREAGAAAYSQVGAPYKRRGGNFHDRRAK